MQTSRKPHGYYPTTGIAQKLGWWSNSSGGIIRNVVWGSNSRGGIAKKFKGWSNSRGGIARNIVWGANSSTGIARKGILGQIPEVEFDNASKILPSARKTQLPVR